MLKRFKIINRWSFDKKMQLLVSTAITLTTMLILISSTISSVTSMRQRAVELIQLQNSTIAENFRSSLENYKTLAIGTILDISIQQYAKDNGADKKKTTELTNNAYNVLNSISNMNSNLNFIAAVGAETGQYLYKGTLGLMSTGFLKGYEEDFEQSKTVQDSTIRMCFNDAYFDGTKYTLSVYFPIYDTEIISRENGMLCMNFTDPSLQQILEDDGGADVETSVVDGDGMLVVGGDGSKIGDNVDYLQELQASPESFVKEGNMYVCQKVKNWNFYVVSSVPIVKLYRSSIRLIFIMVLVLSVLLAVSIRITRNIIRRAYSPLDKVVTKMDDVASGSLKTRINVENMGEDFTKLAVGFNSMMEEIQILMEQVKLEQHQIEQIRFNALQAQIQPHFLYNTLECIHWQALADGNREISMLVMALAKYYRICLSRGRDVISLDTELEHIRNYLIIQNMRYDNAIESVFEADSSVGDAMIPKLTLQPLIENSIYHGMRIEEGKTGTVFVTVKKDGKDILIFVSDTGTGMEQKKIEEMNKNLSEYEESFGYGVRNVNRRIEILYGEQYGLHYSVNEWGGVTVEVRFPYATEVDDNVLRGEAMHV